MTKEELTEFETELITKYNKINALQKEALVSLNTLLAECEKFPNESIKHGNFLPLVREAIRHLNLMF